MTTDWRHAAKCRDMDTELFFPAALPGTKPYKRQVERAKAVCAACPVLTQCRAWALAVQDYGVAGGLDEVERSVRRTRGARSRIRCAGSNEPAHRSPGGRGITRQDHTLDDERRAAAIALLDAGAPPATVAVRFGVTARTVTHWYAAAVGGRGTAVA